MSKFQTAIRLAIKAELFKLSLVFVISLILAPAAQANTIWRDALNDATPWRVIASTQVLGNIEVLRANKRIALCLNYDFNGVSGYVGMQRDANISYPENFRFDFALQGDAPANDLQIKLIDASGDNVWWYPQVKYALPTVWQTRTIKRRNIVKAWGPSTEASLRESAKFELTIASAVGGKGRVCIDSLSLRQIAPDVLVPKVADVRANRGLASAATDNNLATAWTVAVDKAARLQLDLGQVSDLGGLVIDWKGANIPASYKISTANDANNAANKWRVLRTVRSSNGGRDWIALQTEARFIALEIPADKNAHGNYALAEIAPQPLAFATTPNDFISHVAKASPRGFFPRPFLGEQRYWTLLGVDGGSEQGLLSEDGALEIARSSFSVEPFVRVDGQLLSWADVMLSQSLLDGALPIPSVAWQHPNAALRVTAFAQDADASVSCTGTNAQIVARYRLSNPSAQTRDFELVLALQPFQVNPPTQFLNSAGGVSAINELAIDASTVRVNGQTRLYLSQAPDAAFASSFDAGMAVEQLHSPNSVQLRSALDATGLASGALIYKVRLNSQQSYELALVAPLVPASQYSAAAHCTMSANFDASAQQTQVAELWRSKLDTVQIQVPPSGQMLADTLRTAVAHQLISRVGVRLQPGTRSYARSWIRDGAMIAEGLLRTGHSDVVRDFLRWYAPYQFSNGKVPCCVDDRGSDPVPENDSHGQLIFAIAEHARFNNDQAFLEQMWPHVLGAFNYMETLRASERTEANQRQHPEFFGMMPASISHEGYSAKPMHSYWDNFWALRGYKDVEWIAQQLHKPEHAAMRAARDQFQLDLIASIKAATALHKIDYLPGAAELGDFDPTSSTIALAQAGAGGDLPSALVEATFERYWREFVARRDGTHAWKDYTPYEWRNVGALIRLGQRERAWQAAQFFFADRAPLAWNQWAEVVSITPRKPFFLGDLPHAWVASDFVRAALDMFAYSRESDGRVVLAAGIPSDWIAGAGIAITGLRTAEGALSYQLSHDAQYLQLTIADGTSLPDQGAALPWPLANYQPGSTRIDGKLALWKNQELWIPKGSRKVRVGLVASKEN